MEQPLVVDFETFAINGNPTVRPPKAVGVALKNPGYKSRYLCWGHPTGNNCDGPEEAKNIIGAAIDQGRPLLFHNAKFDLAVMEDSLDLTVPDPYKVHDTMYSIFLNDPYASNLSLKPSAERILGMAPEEQADLRAWIISHVQGAHAGNFGAFIAQAPADIVAPYARGDVDRTWALHKHLIDKVPMEAYRREQRLLPILRRSEKRGIRLDQERIERHLERYENALMACDIAIYNMLGAPYLSINLDSGAELADAIDRAGLAGEWVLTPTGRRSTSRGNLEKAIANQELLGLLQYRGALAHCLSNFMRPWTELGKSYGGRLHPEWNQVRQERGARDTKGTRTGRLSCSKPNFQNPPNEYNIVIPGGFPDLPIMRQYLLPDVGYVWIKRDYSQQELRILAHYSEGRLFERYQEDPKIDAHDEAKTLIHNLLGLDLPRKYVKITGFSMIYGSGIASLSEQLGVPDKEGATIKGAYLAAFPEVKDLMDECKESGRAGVPITTWGGRQYLSEPPAIIKGRYQRFDYKLLNYLIQGSAADCTKEAICRWDDNPGEGEFLATVHDEVDAQAPEETAPKDMALLRDAMESIEFDVKMLSDGFMGKSWANLEACA